MERIPVLAAALILVATQPLHAEDDAAKKLHGVWRVTSFKAQIVGDDAAPRDLLGPNPKGYIIFCSGRTDGGSHFSNRSKAGIE